MFDHLKKFEIREALSWLEMPELGPKARILVAPATEANPAYYNAMLKLSGKRVRAMVRSDQITAEDAAQNRDDDRELYPRYVIRGWEQVQGSGDGLDENGHVPFTRENAVKLCRVLPAHLMDRVRNHASTPERFYAPDELPPLDADELAGN